MQDCIFCKIVRGEIPSKKVYEDDDVLAFHDIHPQAPVHFMLMPKRHIASLAEATPDDAPVLGRMLALAGRLAREQGSPDGFRTIVNTGRDRPAGRDARPHSRHRRPGPARADAAARRALTARDITDRGERMGGLSIWHWLIVLLVVVLIFGTKKLRNIGQDLGGAVKGFKEGVKGAETEADAAKAAAAQQIARRDDRRRGQEGEDAVARSAAGVLR